MKKLCILIGLVSSLHGTDNLRLHARTTKARSSIQTQWPLSTALTLVGCGLLSAAYTVYKTCIQRHARRIKTHDTPAQDNTALIKVAAPYFYAYKCNKLILDKIIQIAARDLDIESLLPHGSEHYRPAKPNESYYAPRAEYLSNKVFTHSNISAFNFEKQQNSFTNKYEFKSNGSNEIGSHLYYIMGKDEEATFDPMVFFESSSFLNDIRHDCSIIVDFKCLHKESANGKYVTGPDQYEAVRPADGYVIRLNLVKQGGLVTSTKISDYRNTTNQNELNPEKIMAINQEYIKKLFVMAGGKLYKPTQNKNSVDQKPPIAYAWYNPFGLVHKLLKLI